MMRVQKWGRGPTKLTDWKNRTSKSSQKSSWRVLWNLYSLSQHLLSRSVSYLCLSSLPFSGRHPGLPLQIWQISLPVLLFSVPSYLNCWFSLSTLVLVICSPMYRGIFIFWMEKLITLFLYWTKSHHLRKSWKSHVISPSLSIVIAALKVQFSGF